MSPPKRRIIGLAYTRATQLSGPETAVESWHGLGTFYEFLAEPIDWAQAERCYGMALEALVDGRGRVSEAELRKKLEGVREKRRGQKGSSEPDVSAS